MKPSCESFQATVGGSAGLLRRAAFGAALLLWLSPASLPAQIPQLLNYQGRVQVGTTDFNGTGQFKFALVNADGTATYWSNDGTPAGQPAAAVTLPVTKGLYSVLLGNTALPNMQAMPPTAFANGDVHLRVWFNDGLNGFQQFVPDQRMAATAFALMAGSAQSAGSVSPGAVTSAMLADGAVTVDKLAPGSVTAAITPGSIPGTAVADGSITADKLAPLPQPVGGTMMVVSATSTSITQNVTWIVPPSIGRSAGINFVGDNRRPTVTILASTNSTWTVSRPLSPDFAWKEWLRETAVTGGTNAFRTVQIQFTGGPRLVMTNAFPSKYRIDVTKHGFREIMTVQPNSFEIQ